jgi:hypothetical protein
MTAPYADWLRSLAGSIEKGDVVNPCPKALRAAAAQLDIWVPSVTYHSALSGQQSKSR